MEMMMQAPLVDRRDIYYSSTNFQQRYHAAAASYRSMQQQHAPAAVEYGPIGTTAASSSFAMPSHLPPFPVQPHAFLHHHPTTTLYRHQHQRAVGGRGGSRGLPPRPPPPPSSPAAAAAAAAAAEAAAATMMMMDESNTDEEEEDEEDQHIPMEEDKVGEEGQQQQQQHDDDEKVKEEKERTTSTTTTTTTTTSINNSDNKRRFEELEGVSGMERYTILRQLGQGAYGKVYEAVDREAGGRRVAIKQVSDAFSEHVDALRMYREVRLCRTLHHSNIIHLIDVLTPPPDLSTFNDVYLIFDYSDTDLVKVLNSPQSLTDEHIQYILYQLLLALKHLQASHVIHRDLKPANILIDADCRIRLCDFGLARVVEPSFSEAAGGGGGGKGGGGGSSEEEEAMMMDQQQPSLAEAAAATGGVGRRRSSSRNCGTAAAGDKKGGRGGTTTTAAASAAGEGGSSGAGGGDKRSPGFFHEDDDGPRTYRRQLTRHVVTRWYRAPELLLLQPYTKAVDIWALGCIFSELMGKLPTSPSEAVAAATAKGEKKKEKNHPTNSNNNKVGRVAHAPLFPGGKSYTLSRDTEQSIPERDDQLCTIFQVLGTPTKDDVEGLELTPALHQYLQKCSMGSHSCSSQRLRELYPTANPQGLDLINRMLCFNPAKRITVDEALHHPYLSTFAHHEDFLLASKAHDWSSNDLLILSSGYEGVKKTWQTSMQIKEALYHEICRMKQGGVGRVGREGGVDHRRH